MLEKLRGQQKCERLVHELVLKLQKRLSPVMTVCLHRDEVEVLPTRQSIRILHIFPLLEGGRVVEHEHFAHAGCHDITNHVIHERAV